MWQDDALCRQTGADLHYPEKGDGAHEARAICGRCSVRVECLEYALARREQFGIWGGYTERQRRRMKPGDLLGASS